MIVTHPRTVSRARAGIIAMLLAGGACADDAPSLTTTSDTETTTDEPPPLTTTTNDPDTTVGMETTAGDTTEGPTTAAPTEGTTTSGGACGNGMIEGDEECDGDDLGEQDCRSQGFGDGTLACADDCTFDTRGCTKAPPVCGDDAVGDGEICDGMDLAGEDCESQGFAGGTLACLEDCSGLDTAACVAAGPSDCCVANLGIGCDDPVCEAAICAVDAYCCEMAWDNFCAAASTGIDGNGNQCAICPTPMCGNDVSEFQEECDGTDLAGEDCTTRGFASGNLACAADCLSFDTSGCMDPVQDCCLPQMGLTGCPDPACEAAICGADAYCCDMEWDQVCADAAIIEPACADVGSCPPAPVCGDGAVTGVEPCDGADLDGANCVSFGYAGGGVLACVADCSAFDTSGCIADLACVDEDIGGATGALVTSGNTAGGDSDLDAACGGTGGPDQVITFTAPLAGVYTFDTFGSMFDTKLALFLECNAASEIGCNDDSGPSVQSSVAIELPAGQVILVVVDGYNGATGDWVLNITGP